jgi:hypothetical protein
MHPIFSPWAVVRTDDRPDAGKLIASRIVSLRQITQKDEILGDLPSSRLNLRLNTLRQPILPYSEVCRDRHCCSQPSSCFLRPSFLPAYPPGENLQLIPSNSDASPPSLNRSPTMTHASNGPCLAFIPVILDWRTESAESGEPKARLIVQEGRG